MGLNIVGYITSDSLRTGFVSQQVQNQAIGSFLAGQSHLFLLSWTEFKGCAPFIFRSLLKEKFYDGICFYSLEQLASFPESMEVLKSLSSSGRWTGFAKEGVFFQGALGFQEIARLWWLKSEFERPRLDLDSLWRG